MIKAVSGISFKGEGLNAQELINSPGQYTTAPQMEATDTFEKSNEGKKSNNGLITTIVGALALAGAFLGLGYAVTKGHGLEKIDIPAEGFLAKAKAYGQNAAAKVCEWAETSFNWVAKFFNRGKAAEVVE